MSEVVAMLNGERLLTTLQAAERLGMNPGSLRNTRVTGRGGLPWVKVGRSVYYRERDVQALTHSLLTITELREAKR